jgi:hypothetical protein
MNRQTKYLYLFFGIIGTFVIATNVYIALTIGRINEPFATAPPGTRPPSLAPFVNLIPARSDSDVTASPAPSFRSEEELATGPPKKVDHGDNDGGGESGKRKHSKHGKHKKQGDQHGKRQAERNLKKERQAFAVDSVGFAPSTYEEYLKQYDDFLKQDVGKVNQSSISFIDFHEDAHAGVKLPDEPVVAKADDAPDVDGDDCDPRDNRFTKDLDEKCRSYMADPANWQSIKPMSSILSTGRTIKFKVFLGNGAAAVMKVSQNKFILEPSSEMMAYETDRLLGFNRVPPTVWVSFPIKYLKAACATKGAFYVHWFQAFVLDYKQAASVQHVDSPTSEPTVYISLQLWMSDVHNADETALKPPSNYQQALDAGLPYAAALSESARRAVVELSDVSLFDFVIGNTDRWFGHNSFVYGGCDDPNEPTRCHNVQPDTTIRGNWSYAYIDQGSSFYKSGPPEENMYYGNKAEATHLRMCRFRRTTVENLLNIGKPKEDTGDLVALMRARLPKGIFNIGNPYLVKAARTRLEHLVKMFDGCLAKFPRDDVLYF